MLYRSKFAHYLISTVLLLSSLPARAAASGSGQAESTAPTVAILLFDGVQIIDYSGPWEVFGQAGFKVHTVAEKTEPVTTRFGQKVTPDYTFDNSPRADILLLPGGQGSRQAAENPRVIKWIQDSAKDAKHVMSVCTGALLLAKAGLLDGLTATTFHDAIPVLSSAAPKTKVVYDQRYVDNGKVVTTAGLSSGIDGALHLVGKIQGQGQAQWEALVLEYTWETDSKNACAAFADRYLPGFDSLDGKITSVEGDLDHWELHARISKPGSVGEIIEMARKEVVSATPHASSAVTLLPQATNASSKIEWRFTDDLGRGWAGYLGAEPSEERGKSDISLRLVRAGVAQGSPAPITDDVSIRDGWVQEGPPSKDITAAYLKIENRSGADMSLLSATTDAARVVELHKVEMDNGMMKMRRVDGIAIPAGGLTELKPGGYHLMVIGLRKPLKEGDKVTLTLKFSRSIQKTITVPVKPRSSISQED